MADMNTSGLEEMAELVSFHVGAWQDFGYEKPPAPDSAVIPPLGERSANAVKAGHEAVEDIDRLIARLHQVRARLMSELRQDEDIRAARVDTMLAARRDQGPAVTTQANRAGRPWQRKDGRWSVRAYPPDGSTPRTVYGKTEDEALARQHEIETGQAAPPANPYLDADERNQPPRPPKPVRFTLDLDQERHTFLKQFALECGAGTGGAAVMRALLDELREGANLPMRVRSRIQAEKR